VHLEQLNTRIDRPLDFIEPNEMPSQIKETIRMLFPSLFQSAEIRRKTVVRRILPHRQRPKRTTTSQANRRVVILFFDRDETADHELPRAREDGAYGRGVPALAQAQLHPALHRSERPHEDRRPPEIPVLRSRVRRLQGRAGRAHDQGVENGATEVAATVAYANGMYMVKLPDTPRASLPVLIRGGDSWITARTTPRRRRFGRAPRSRRSGRPLKDRPFLERLKYYPSRPGGNPRLDRSRAVRVGKIEVLASLEFPHDVS